MTWQWLAVRHSVQRELRSLVASDATYRWDCLGGWLRAGGSSSEAQGMGEVTACQRQIWWFPARTLAPELQSTITCTGRQFPRI
jgi:hypothetical protein